MLVKLEWFGYHITVKKLWWYVKPFSYNTSVSRTDRQTDGQTELLYQYRASVCWRAIKTEISILWRTLSLQNIHNHDQLVLIDIVNSPTHISSVWFWSVTFCTCFKLMWDRQTDGQTECDWIVCSLWPTTWGHITQRVLTCSVGQC